MTSVGTTRSMADFFVWKEPYDNRIPQCRRVELKEGMEEEFLAFCAQQEEAARAADFAASKQEPMKPVVLTPDQLSYLTEKYDPRQMSKEEYYAFIQDMVDMGVVKEEDRHFLVPGLTPLWGLGCFGSRTLDTSAVPDPDQYDGWYVPTRYENSHGNILNWHGYQAAFRAFDGESGTWFRSKRERVYEKTYNVLQQMSQNAPAPIRQEQMRKDYLASRLVWDRRG